MLARPRILVADDDLGIRDLIRTRLVMAGYDVHTARHGGEALGRACELRPDAMVLDINMPEVDGFGVLQGLRDRGKRIPVLMLTARHDADDVRRAMTLGAKDYLCKPFNENQLLARVARLLRPPIATPAAPPTLVPADQPAQ